MLARFHCAIVSCQILCIMQLHVVHSCAFVFLSEYSHTCTQKVPTVFAIHVRYSGIRPVAASPPTFHHAVLCQPVHKGSFDTTRP